MATRLVTRHYDKALAPAGVSTCGYSLLVRLGDEGPLALGALAGRLAMDRSTLSREIAPLIRVGLVEDDPDAADRRRRVLALSTAGHERLRLAHPLWEQAQGELIERFGIARATGLVEELNALVGAEA
jgi:DNA-binding MarR family transcriptional regulator